LEVCISEGKPTRKRSIVRVPERDSAAKCRAADAAVVAQVVRLYAACKFLPPVVSSNLDETSTSSRWSESACFVVCDTERCVEAALNGNPSHLDYFWKWFVLNEIDGPDVPTSPEEARLHAEIIRRCARIFRAKGLAPTWKYLGLHGAQRRAIEGDKPENL
jgi:hypothetical protein